MDTIQLVSQLAVATCVIERPTRDTVGTIVSGPMYLSIRPTPPKEPNKTWKQEARMKPPDNYEFRFQMSNGNFN